MPFVPNYASNTSARQPHAWLYVAYGCAIGPIISGVSIVTAYAVTRNEKLVGAGIAMLAVGFAVVALGFNLAHEYRERCVQLVTEGNLVRPLPRWPALLLLWLNFPIGIGCALIGFLLM